MKLTAYYEGPGAGDPVLIELRPGSYVPLFRPIVAGTNRGAAVPPIATEYTTVAVLPFANMSPEPDQDYFCDKLPHGLNTSRAAVINVHTLDVLNRLGVAGELAAQRSQAEEFSFARPRFARFWILRSTTCLPRTRIF